MLTLKSFISPLQRLIHLPRNAFAFALLGMSITACSPEQNAGASNPDNSHQPYYHKVNSKVLEQLDGYSVLRKFSGTVVSKQTAQLNFEVAGRVDNIAFFEGDMVNKGEVIATLNTELLNIEKQQLSAQLKQIDAEIVLAKANLERVNSLINDGYASKQNLDELNAQQQVLIATQQQLAATIKAKQYQISHAEITAPFSGVINQRNINIGEVINSSKIAFELQKQQESELKVGVPQHLISQIRQHQKFNLLINNTKVKVSELAINSRVNLQNRTIQLRFPLPSELTLFDNQLGYFEFEQFYPQTGFWVPITALTDGIRGTWNVYTIEPSDNEQLYKLVNHSVEVIHTEQDTAFIRGNLKSGQQLLADGLQRVVPGQIVKIAE
ncbi:efflux RND transporter periplasmic adaptor subunit [Thalassomonas sp. M1454]|uniref:efflux RND transporter periplasmic adaptor subunit n=1 Tax=Thalassomonas sp. M1454 TaxID=2594477 RepID=UPI001181319E|nr:efflux RND transporter periplasmic adaptor subunit [Thalassomonas sp. M1454]TRX55679.1 efflux RND transporter periplasmic adaptor subunit [Thalassomonas sp. M1454]